MPGTGTVEPSNRPRRASTPTCGRTSRTRSLRAGPLRQRRLQLRQQVVDVLDSHREPNQAVGDAQRLADLPRNAGMGPDRRMPDQALDPAERLRPGEQVATLPEPSRLLEAHLDARPNQASEPPHLPPPPSGLRGALPAGSV